MSAGMVDNASKVSWLATSVYGPTNRSLRDSFWGELDSIRSYWSGPWCSGGDWNIVRFPSEKLGDRNTTTSDMLDFSEWINKQSALEELNPALSICTLEELDSLGPITNLLLLCHVWTDSSSPVLLDGFFLSCDWLELFPEACQSALRTPSLIIAQDSSTLSSISI